MKDTPILYYALKFDFFSIVIFYCHYAFIVIFKYETILVSRESMFSNSESWSLFFRFLFNSYDI